MTERHPSGLAQDFELQLRQPPVKRLKLYVAEEQQLFRDAYRSAFLTNPGIEVVGVSTDTAGDSLAKVASALEPDVMLVGLKILKKTTVDMLEVIRENRPEMAIVLLSAHYDVQGMKGLREFSRRYSAGCAYLLKHTIDTMEQLTEVIHSVAQGRIIVDPMVMEALINLGDARSSFLRQLSPRELEVLSWMAKGYRNNTIAEVLFLEPKTVERHINSIFTKINVPESRHARVAAVRMYLTATGQLPLEEPDTE
jgi:DNA-binding NarL/FixJ family response regulator